MAQYTKPLPTISAMNKPFWDALKQHELRMQRCGGCGKFWDPPGPFCPACWSKDFSWEKLSGRGRVSSWVIFHDVFFPSFAADIPYNVAEVELDEGPRLTANLVGIKNEDIRAGMPVEVMFDDVTEQVTLARFRPV